MALYKYCIIIIIIRIITRPSLTGDRVTDHGADNNHSVIRHNHQSSPWDSGRRPQETVHHLTTRVAVASGTVSSREPPRMPQL